MTGSRIRLLVGLFLIFQALMLLGLLDIITAFILGVLYVLLIYLTSPQAIVEKLMAIEVDRDDYPELYEIVEHLSEKAKVRRPRIYIVDDVCPNAFTAGTFKGNYRLFLTQGLIELLDRDELETVIAHEISHLKRGDTKLQTFIYSLALTFSVFTWWPFSLMFVPGILRHGLRELTYINEIEADREAVKLTGKPLKLASALLKIGEFYASSDVGDSLLNLSSHLFLHPFEAGNKSLLETRVNLILTGYRNYSPPRVIKIEVHGFRDYTIVGAFPVASGILFAVATGATLASLIFISYALLSGIAKLFEERSGVYRGLSTLIYIMLALALIIHRHFLAALLGLVFGSYILYGIFMLVKE